MISDLHFTLTRLRIELTSKLRRVRYKPFWQFEVTHEGEFLAIRVAVTTMDADAPNPLEAPSVKLQHQVGVSEHEAHRALEDDEFFMWLINRLVTTAEMHEVGEWLRFDDKKPFDPHKRRT